MVPAAPVLTSVVAISSSQIRLDWNDSSNNETGFKVYRWNGSAWILITTLAANAISYTDSGLAAGTFYAYWVWSYSPGADSYSPTSLWSTTYGP